MHMAFAKEKHDRQTDGWMMDKVIPMWRFALLAPQEWFFCKYM